MKYHEEELEKRRSNALRLERELRLQTEENRKLEWKMQTEIQRIQNEFNERMNEKEREVGEIAEATAKSEKMRMENRILEEVVTFKKKELEQAKKRFNEEVVHIRMTFNEQRTDLKNEFEMEKQRLHKELEDRVLALVGQKTHEIRDTNLKLMKQSKCYEDEVIAIGAQNNELLEENKKLVRDKELDEMGMRMYVEQGVRLAKDYREAQYKIRQLERSLACAIDEKRRAQNELKLLEDHHAELMRDKEREFEKVQIMLQRRTNDLLHLKKAARKVLTQRSELEKFFMDALEHVQNEKILEMEKRLSWSMDSGLPHIRRRRRQRQQFDQKKPRKSHPASAPSMFARRRGVSSVHEPSLPQISRSCSLETNSEYEDSDFKFLTWEEKEQVLRLLFAKINSVPAMTVPHDPVSESRPLHHVTPVSSKPSTASGGRQCAHGQPLVAATEKHDSTFITNNENQIVP